MSDLLLERPDHVGLAAPSIGSAGGEGLGWGHQSRWAQGWAR